MATFSWPSRAEACATAVPEASVPLGFAVRGGVHTGECAVVGDHLSGSTVRVSCARRASPIIELLASCDETGWVKPWLCEGWTVRVWASTPALGVTRAARDNGRWVLRARFDIS